MGFFSLSTIILISHGGRDRRFRGVDDSRTNDGYKHVLNKKTIKEDWTDYRRRALSADTPSMSPIWVSEIQVVHVSTLCILHAFCFFAFSFYVNPLREPLVWWLGECIFYVDASLRWNACGCTRSLSPVPHHVVWYSEAYFSPPNKYRLLFIFTYSDAKVNIKLT